MESEKVKEIKVKETLEILCYKYKDVGSWEVTKLQLMDILTLINDLENNYQNVCVLLTAKNEQIVDLTKENQKLKDRIAELEKENAKLLDSVETVQSNRCVYKCVLTKEHLKQFAEKLKEKCEWNRKQYCCSATVSVIDIDETLKEFLRK